MTIELSTVFSLRRGWLTSASVGPLASDGADYLESSTADVRLSHEQLLHIDKHGGFDDLDLITIPYGLRHGLFIGDAENPNVLIISYLYPDNGYRYKVVIKSTAAGRELWVCTFHRMRPRQTKYLLKRGIVVKTHA